MLLVILSAPPPTPALVTQVAALAGLAPVEVRQRLGGLLPRVLCMGADAGALGTLAHQLNALGLHTGVCDPRLATRDDDRLIARRLEFQPDGIKVEANDLQTEFCPYAAMELCQRGARTQDESVATTTQAKKFSATRAFMSGGLLVSKNVSQTEVKHVHKSERLVVIHRNDGGKDIMLYERHMDYRFLGANMQPVALANLDATRRLLHEGAPSVRWDERVAQPGFVQGLPRTGVDGIDLALYLVRLAVRAGTPYRVPS